MLRLSSISRHVSLLLFLGATGLLSSTAQPTGLVPKFELKPGSLVLERPSQKGAFFDVLGRRSAAFGYENEPVEVWTHPLKILKDFQLSFQIENYPLEIFGVQAMSAIEVRPEATILTYRHAAFTVRQIIFAPVDQPAIVMLLDIDSARPLRIAGSFRPDLKLMWPAGLMTGNLGWDGKNERYFIVEETGRFAGTIGAPGAADVSVMPYQEEPRDVPTRFFMDTTPEVASEFYYPIIVTGSTDGRDAAETVYDTLLRNVRRSYDNTRTYYDDLLSRTTTVTTPDSRLNTALEWAKVGIEKGFADNPTLGTGLVAGFRTSGASERPGFAWYFGRDALWTVFAQIAYGDYEGARTALDFLTAVQRDDGKIPHEISQSAAFLPWFEEYPYPWNSADATPLYIIAQADLWRATGDIEYLRGNWDAIKAAYRFSAATDTDGNGLIENTDVGHGWVEGGELYPAHEEIYMQGLWIQATRDLAELARVMNQPDLAREANRAAERTRTATEATYWLEDRGFYAFATRSSDANDLYREDTVLPAVPMWWGTLDADRSERQADRLGSGDLATDWGTRILSERSPLYDPLSYHNGSVWPLFTGWASMGAYRYHRPHVGFQALMATALLTYQDALGYVTELLSGQYNTAFGRSSHHQVWSEAMVTSPAIRGMLGLEVLDGGATISLAPQIPGSWDSLKVTRIRAGDKTVLVDYQRGEGEDRYRFATADGSDLPTINLKPAFPRDTRIAEVTADGVAQNVSIETRGDALAASVRSDPTGADTEFIYRHDGGTSVFVPITESVPGARSIGLRILRSRPTEDALELVLEGLADNEYGLYIRSPKTVGQADRVQVDEKVGDLTKIRVRFGAGQGYVRRIVRLSLR